MNSDKPIWYRKISRTTIRNTRNEIEAIRNRMLELKGNETNFDAVQELLSAALILLAD